MYPSQQSQELRRSALSLAIDAKRDDPSLEVVATAEKYLEFLKGNSGGDK